MESYSPNIRASVSFWRASWPYLNFLSGWFTPSKTKGISQCFKSLRWHFANDFHHNLITTSEVIVAFRTEYIAQKEIFGCSWNVRYRWCIPVLNEALNPLKLLAAFLALLIFTQAMFPELCIFCGKLLPHRCSASIVPYSALRSSL